MKAVILAGGFGTRLSEETEVIPKPMIEIGHRPILWHLMKIFSTQGVDDFAVALGYKGHVIKKYFLDYPKLESDLRIDLATGMQRSVSSGMENWVVDLVDTGHNVMTGGRLKRLAPLLQETFLFTYGDGLANVDVQQLVAFHRAHGRLATVTAVRPPGRFGILDISEDGRVSRFAEKPPHEENWINGGFFVLEPAILEYIDGDSTSWEQEPCQRLAAEGQLVAYRHEGFWQCMDTLHELRKMRDIWTSGQAPWKIW